MTSFHAYRQFNSALRDLAGPGELSDRIASAFWQLHTVANEDTEDHIYLKIKQLNFDVVGSESVYDLEKPLQEVLSSYLPSTLLTLSIKFVDIYNEVVKSYLSNSRD